MHTSSPILKNEAAEPSELPHQKNETLEFLQKTYSNYDLKRAKIRNSRITSSNISSKKSVKQKNQPVLKFTIRGDDLDNNFDCSYGGGDI